MKTTTTKTGRKLTPIMMKAGETTDDAIARVKEEPLPGQEEEAPALKVARFVKATAGISLEKMNLDHYKRVAEAAAPEEREQLLSIIRASRPDLAELADKVAAIGKGAAKKKTVAQEVEAGLKLEEKAAAEVAARPLEQLVTEGRAVLGDEEPKKPIGFTTPSGLVVEAVPPRATREPDQHVPFLALSLLVASPTQPRKTFNVEKLEELAESIREVGVLQPLLVRRVPGQADAFEVVAGERRWRAADKAGLLGVPAIVRDLTDREVIEAQLVENGQRVDLTPLEEGDTFARLHRDYGLAVDEIAKRVGKTKATVYARIKLSELSPIPRGALERGELSPSVALLIARIPSAKLQEQATKEVLRADWQQPMSAREAEDHIARRFTLDLKAAPFDTKDDLLLAGRAIVRADCGTCPYRSGNCRELTPEIKSADVCTDPDCYQEKVAAHVDAQKTKAEASGRKWLADGAASKLFKYGDHQVAYDADYVAENVPQPDDSRRRTWSELVTKAEQKTGEKLERFAAASPSGKIVDLFHKRDALNLLKKISGSKVAKDAKEREEKREERKKEEEGLELRTRVAGAIVAAAVEHVEKKGLELWALKLIATKLIDLVAFDQAGEAAMKRRNFETPEGLIQRVAKKADAKEIAGLLLELSVDTECFGGYPDELRLLAKTVGVDVKKLEKDQAIQLELAKEIAKGEAAAKRKAAKK